LRFQTTLLNSIKEVSFAIVLLRHIYCGKTRYLLRWRTTHDQKSRHIFAYKSREATSLSSKNCRHSFLFLALD